MPDPARPPPETSRRRAPRSTMALAGLERNLYFSSTLEQLDAARARRKPSALGAGHVGSLTGAPSQRLRRGFVASGAADLTRTSSAPRFRSFFFLFGHCSWVTFARASLGPRGMAAASPGLRRHRRRPRASGFIRIALAQPSIGDAQARRGEGAADRPPGMAQPASTRSRPVRSRCRGLRRALGIIQRDELIDDVVEFLVIGHHSPFYADGGRSAGSRGRCRRGVVHRADVPQQVGEAWREGRSPRSLRQLERLEPGSRPTSTMASEALARDRDASPGATGLGA